jgi:MOSC domain-containing protein YiiM
MPGCVIAVSQRGGHHFSKTPCLTIRLLEGLGVEGDGHAGATVKHRSRARYNPSAPNLRQVHLLHQELLDELAPRGFAIRPGQIGENILTSGIDLLGLPTGTVLVIGAAARVTVTGLRNPCVQLDRFMPGLMAATLGRDETGALVRKAGVMAIVAASGEVRPGDPIAVALPERPWTPLQPV